MYAYKHLNFHVQNVKTSSYIKVKSKPILKITKYSIYISEPLFPEYLNDQSNIQNNISC